MTDPSETIRLVKHGDEISQHEALNYFQGWSEATRNRVRGEIERMGADRFVVNNRETGYWNSVVVFVGDTFVADLLLTKIWFAPEFAPEDAEDDGHKKGLLSVMLEGVTRANRSTRSAGRPEVEPTFCPNHPGIALPASGLCDYC